MTESVERFLQRYGMMDPAFDFDGCVSDMCADMRRGLNGEESSYPMIPTFLKTSESIPENQYAVVIDAGGTNFRRGLAHFENGRCIIERVQKTKMPGIDRPATWQEFISFVADEVQELVSYTDLIGFCFSYSAEITPEVDGKVICIDKEVSILGCEGKLVGQSLSEELAARGFPGKRVVILNDTAAVQLGGLAKHLNDGYTACFGQVSGTGSNTCCTVRGEQIRKVPGKAFDMIVNLECGSYDGLHGGVFDRELDRNTHSPGTKHFEKMTAGVYLGELCHRALCQAGKDGLLSNGCAEILNAMPHIDSSLVDDWAAGNGLSEIAENETDIAVISEVARFLFRRSALLMCANLVAMAELTDAGLHGEKAAIFAEGSLVQRNHFYAPELMRLLKIHLQEERGRDVSLVIEDGTTLPGAAAAVLMNAG